MPTPMDVVVAATRDFMCDDEFLVPPDLDLLEHVSDSLDLASFALDLTRHYPAASRLDLKSLACVKSDSGPAPALTAARLAKLLEDCDEP